MFYTIMADWIRLRDIVCYGYTGVLSEERILGQRFIIHVDLQTDLSLAERSDNLSDTGDYAELLSLIRFTVSEQKFHLIETMASTIAAQIKQDARIERVRVEVCKLNPPIPDFTGSVAVEIWR